MSAELTASPRTQEKPMAFDSGEFASGAARAVLLHLVLFASTSGLISLAICVGNMINEPLQAGSALSGALGLSMLVMIFGVPISLVAALIGVLPALLLGRGMARLRAFRTHLLAWCAFGIAFCSAVSVAVVYILHFDQMTWISAFIVAGFVSGATAIPVAWVRTVSIALREDRGLKPLPWFRCRTRRPVRTDTKAPGPSPYSDR